MKNIWSENHAKMCKLNSEKKYNFNVFTHKNVIHQWVTKFQAIEIILNINKNAHKSSQKLLQAHMKIASILVRQSNTT